jgi:DeoR family deoxyribose operon repressor
MTIRRDIDEILKDPDIQMIRGVFLFTPSQESEENSNYSVISASTEHKEAKQRIADEAVKMIEPNDHILLDAGSTTEFLAKSLPGSRTHNVLCFSLNILNIILTKNESFVTIPGGRYHSSSMMFESREGIDLVKNSRVNKAFISASGVNLRLGATCSAEFERDLKKSALESAQTRILLVDSSKFNKIQSLYFADLKNFDIIITDRDIPDEIAREIRGWDIELRIV